MRTGRVLSRLAVMSLLGFTGVGAQNSSVSTETRRRAPAPEPSIVRAADHSFPAEWPVAPREASNPAFQLEEKEPGSFILGAVMGGVATAVLLLRREEGDGDPFLPWVPIGAFIGGMITWSAGIG